MFSGDVQAVERIKEAYEQITRELAKTIVGQHDVIEELMIALFARGHCLLVGVPGLAKTLIVRSLAEALGRLISSTTRPRCKASGRDL